MSEPTKCANCGYETDDLVTWLGESSTFEYARNPGYFPKWCRLCTLPVQIAHAEKMAAELPRLKAQLAEVEAARRAIRQEGR